MHLTNQTKRRMIQGSQMPLVKRLPASTLLRTYQVSATNQTKPVGNGPSFSNSSRTRSCKPLPKRGESNPIDSSLLSQEEKINPIDSTSTEPCWLRFGARAEFDGGRRENELCKPASENGCPDDHEAKSSAGTAPDAMFLTCLEEWV